VDVVRHLQLDAGVPARAIHHENELLRRAGPDLAREFGQLDFKDRNADRCRQMEDRASRGGMHEADEIAPGEAMLDDGGWTRATRRPDPAEQRLQADTVVIGGPQFTRRLGECIGDRPYERAELFLKSSCCTVSARA